MKKIFIIGVVVIAVGAVILISNGKKGGELQMMGDSNTELTYSGTLKDFMSGAFGTNIYCEMNENVGEDNELNVKTYMAGEKMRVDYRLKDPVSGQRDMHIVSDGEYSYIWGDSMIGNMTGGMKIKLDDTEYESDDLEDGGVFDTAMIDEDLMLPECESWKPDYSLFEIPGDIDFMDPNNIVDFMDSDYEPVVGGGEQCLMCHQLPADQIADCLAALGCAE